MHEIRALTDFHVHFVFDCPEARLRLQLNALAIFEYFYTKLMYTQSVMFSERGKTSDISK